MASVGTAFVDVRADLSKFSADVDQGASSLMAKFGAAIKDNLGKIAIVGAAVALEQIGEKFDEAFDKIRIQTGATGDALKGLEGDFKKTLSGVPSSMGDVSTAIGGISQKLGLTGAPLQKLSTQILTLSRITKTDLNANIQAVTGTFNQWGISAADQGTKLDELFRVSQKTGISVTQLGETMSSGGVRFREAGLSFEQSASLLGLLAKNGLDANAVMPALSRALATAAKDGKPAQQVFQDTFEAIRNAPNDTEAAGVALKVFGARAGPQFAALIREGKLSYEDFSKAIAEGGDTIMEAANQTDDWREKLETLKNKALVALEPIASRVFETLTNVIGFAADAIERFSKSPAWELIRDTILPGIGHAFQDFLFSFQNPDTAINATGWEGVVFRVAAAFGKAFAAIKTAVGATVDWIVANWPHVQDAINKTVDWLKAQDWNALFERIRAGYLRATDWIVNTGVPSLGLSWQWLKDQTAALAEYVAERWADIQAAVHNALVAMVAVFLVTFGPLILLWQGAHDQLLNIANDVWKAIQQLIGFELDQIRNILDIVLGLLSGDWGRAWNGFTAIFTDAWARVTALITIGCDTVRNIVDGACAAIASTFREAWHVIVGDIAPFLRQMNDAFLDGVSRIGAVLAFLWETIKAQARATWDAIDQAVHGTLGAIEAFVAGVFDRIVGFVAGLPGRAAAALSGLFGAVFGPLVAPFIAAAGIIIGNLQRILDMIERVKNAATLGALGDAGKAVAIANGTKSAGGRLATSPIVSLIGEAGNEAVINGDQAVRLLWLMANGGTPAASSPTSSGQTVNINVQAEAKVADADELYSVFRRGELLVGARR